ncbi:TlpA disulfide reductase family protein [Actinokineospora pegani]|uniref:TlpA disulfide reductase family protein n=1 Tax=Actinokineospora pegani TaxID=2654637 RepID=UPI0012EACC39|nr:TlpA disulfide reductase family protein [Actinokineospora pegani]
MRARGMLALAVCAALAGCSAPAPPGTVGNPGGKLIPAAERVLVEGISGDSLLAPGTTVSLSDFADEAVVLNVWGAWCGPCRAETVELAAAHETTAELPVGFLGIDVRDNDRGFAEDFARDRAVPYPSIYDPAARTLLRLGRYRGVAVPTTLVLDRRHRVAAFFIGGVLADDIVPVVRQVAAE